MSQLQHILFRRDRLSLLGAVSLAILAAMTASIFLTAIPQVQAAAPTGTSATMQSSSQSALTVDVVVTGTDFDQFISAQAAGADATDLLKITYGGINPSSAFISNATTMLLIFPAATLGTDKTGGSLTIAAGAVEDAGNVANDLITIADGSITDSASPIVISISTHDIGADGLTANGKVDHVRLFYSEPIDDTTINNYAAAVDYTPTSFAIANVTSEAIDAGEGICPSDATEADAYLCVTFDEDAGTCDDSSQVGCDTDAIDQDVTYTGASATIEDLNFNAAPDLASGNVTEADSANPVLLVATKTVSSGLNRIVLGYSEPMTVSDGASTAAKGDITAFGTVAGFGSFATTGDVTVNTLKNTVGGNTTDTLTVDLAGQIGGVITSAAGVEPSGVFTPVASSAVTDASAALNQVSTAATNPTSASALAWDLAKPTITTATVNDASGNNGKVDQVAFDFSESMRDSSFSDVDTTMGVTGTTLCDFNSGTANDDLTNCDRINETSVPIDTTTTEGNFLYSGVTTLITDMAGNPLNTDLDGTIASGDVIEADGAKPVVTAVDFAKTTISSISYDSVTITYSEAVDVSNDAGGDADIAPSGSGASSASLGGMTSAATLTGIGTWATGTTGDMTTSVATGGTVALNGTGKILTVSFNTATASYFNAGTIAPGVTAFTPTADATDIADAANNSVNGSQAAVTTTNGTAWDVAVPTVSNTYSCDPDTDGDISVMQATFSESMLDASIAFANFEADNDTTNSGTGEEVPASFTSSTSGCDGLSDADANDDKGDFAMTTGIAGTDSAYLHNVTAGARDWAGNRLAAGSALGTENDKASPLLTTSSPVSAASGVSNSANIVLTFTEAMDTTSTDYLLSGYAGSYNADAWTVSDTVLTIDPAGTLAAGSHTFTLNTLDDASSNNNVFGGATSTAAEPFSFIIASSSSSSGGGGSSAATYTINLTSPDGTETALAGDSLNIAWSTGGTGSISYIDLSYSTDGGTSYTMIADNTANDGAYSWTIPNIAGGTSVKVKAEATDLSAVLATDTSASFTLGGSTTPTPSEPVTAPSTGNMGVSPVTGLPEEISQVSAGQYVKSPFFSTVYYVDSSLVRHPFIDSQTYFTWQNTFDVVITVTDATLPTLPLGTPMLPKPGVVLVKIQSVNKVYAVVSNPNDSFKPTLRWIGSESLATQLYGSAWADYVIDIAPTSLSRFLMGEDVITAGDLTVNRSIMKTRNWLNR